MAESLQALSAQSLPGRDTRSLTHRSAPRSRSLDQCVRRFKSNREPHQAVADTRLFPLGAASSRRACW